MRQVRSVSSKDIFPLVGELLKNGQKACITVTGMSMYPFLRHAQDKVELSQTDFGSIKPGDIVLITRKNGEYVLHRVQRKKKDCFYMAGDAQGWVEGPIYPDQLFAVVTAAWRGEKRVERASLFWIFFSEVWRRLFILRRYSLAFYGRFKQLIIRNVS